MQPRTVTELGIQGWLRTRRICSRTLCARSRKGWKQAGSAAVLSVLRTRLARNDSSSSILTGTFGVLHHQDLFRAEKIMRQDQGAQHIFGDDASRVAQHVRLAGA